MNSYVKIKIICRHPHDFLIELINNKVNIHNIVENKNNLLLIVDRTEIDKIEKIKLIHKIEIIEYYGINKFIYQLRKYKILLIAFIFGIVINILLSHVIFNVDVQTTNIPLQKIIIRDLKEKGITKYHLKKSKNSLKKIKEHILLKERNQIEWLEIETHGTSYVVKIEERKLRKDSKKCSPRNIVAKKNAVITKITSSSGEIVKSKFNYVEKNEVIISGLIHNKDKIVSKKCAKGSVYGEVWYNISIIIPEHYKKTKELDNNSYGISINVFSKSIDLNHKFITYKKNEYNIVNSKIIPININFTKYKQLRIIKKNYNLNNTDNVAYKEAIKSIKKKIGHNPNIIDKKVLKKEINNSKIKIDVFLSVEEEISKYQDISLIDIEAENKKEE